MFFKKEQQKIYREILDGQVKAKPLGGLINPYIQNNYNNSDYIEKVHVHEGNLNEIINDIKKEENNPNVSSTPNKYFNSNDLFFFFFFSPLNTFNIELKKL